MINYLPCKFEEAMELAIEVEGWVEEDGVTAHVDRGTELDY